MKTSLCLLLLSLAATASAAPLSPGATMAIGAAVAATNQSTAPSTPLLNLQAPSLRPTMVLPVTRPPVCVLPGPVQAARPAPRPPVSR